MRAAPSSTLTATRLPTKVCLLPPHRAFVGHAVVPATEETEVAETGGSSVRPVGDVMGVAPAVGSVASRVGATPIPGDQGAADGGGDDAGGAAHVEHSTSVGDDSGDRGVTGDPLRRFRSDHETGEFARLADLATEDVGHDRERHLRAEAPAHRDVAVPQVIRADLRQRIDTSLPQCAIVRRIQEGGFDERFERRGDESARLGIEITVEADHSSEGFRHRKTATVVELLDTTSEPLPIGSLSPVVDGATGVTHLQTGDGVDQDLLVASERIGRYPGGVEQHRHPGTIDLGRGKRVAQSIMLGEPARFGHQSLRLRTGHTYPVPDESGRGQMAGLVGAATIDLRQSGGQGRLESDEPANAGHIAVTQLGVGLMPERVALVEE